MKTKYFAYCVLIAVVLTACKQNMNEPSGSVIVDGKAKITIAAPKLSTDGGHQTSARKVDGRIQGSNIVFDWTEEDVINFIYYNSNNEQIGTDTYIVQESDIQDDKSIEFEIPIPSGTDHYDVVTGPEELPTQQKHRISGITTNIMRFEKTGCTLQEQLIQVNPIWSAIIIEPRYTFSFAKNIVEETCRCTIGIDYITVVQTIGSDVTTITYAKSFNSQGEPKAITKEGSEGASPATPYVVVVNPAESCDLSIHIHYNNSLFKGTGENKSGDEISLIPSQEVSPISMHTEGGAIKNLLSGNAYDIESIKDHPITILWDIDEE